MTRKPLIITCALVVIALIGVTPTAWAQGQDATILINKSRPLRPLDYAPRSLMVPPVLLAEPADDPEMQLAPMAASGLDKLFKAANFSGIDLVLSSGYRPYEDQVVLYNTGLQDDATATKESIAVPGYSEHQTGLAADVITSDYVCAAQGCFALTRAAAWLGQNSYKYGFIVRYPLYKTASTGYEYEPWHLRYVGIPLATRLYHQQETLEEFYGLP